ncbi:MAG: hypothetical protein ACRD1N_02870 [Terriglobia bacterium]
MDRRDFLKTGAAGALGRKQIWGASAFAAQASGAPETVRQLDLSNAVVFAPPGLSKREQKAVQVLIEEVERRTEVRWRSTESWPASAPVRVVVAPARAVRQLGGRLPQDILNPKPAAEGFALRCWDNGAPSAAAIGADERGVLFGVGGLLRALRMSKDKIELRAGLRVSTSPRYPLRGHQLGYRPKTNSYDGWTVAMWDQYIRELAVFGTNAIELIPPRSDDEPDSPNFWLPPKQMMVEMSRICDSYGLDVWIWYPAMDKDYSNPQTVESALAEWGRIFEALPRIDAIFVPGGDPGHTEPKYLLALLEKQHANLRRSHPSAATWISPQSFNQAWMDEFFRIVDTGRPAWLAGVVFGPQISIDLPAFRKRLPRQYPIRLYPDITHSLQCQYPVPQWDIAYAHTEGREVINPRPESYANIWRLSRPYTIGFISYSEGCNDDANKFLLSSLAWNPEAKVADVLRDYSRYFISDELADGFAQGLLSLEQNWRAPLLSNENVLTTLRQFQAMEQQATPHDLLKWRFQQGLYRAYYDAYVRARLIHETALEHRACAKLEEVRRLGVRPVPLSIGARTGFSTNELDVRAALAAARNILDEAFAPAAAEDWRTRILELGEALYQSIRMQLAVERYQAEAVGRGGTLDTLDAPITNLPWLRRRVDEIRALPSEDARIDAILELLDRTNPGPGGFYDDLGNVARQPHLARGLGSVNDPEFRASSLAGFGYPDYLGDRAPVAWKNWAESLFDAPLVMNYRGLDAAAHYRVRVVYAGDSMSKKIRMAANENVEIHGYIEKPWPVKPLEFAIPKQATASGKLQLRWYREPGLGGNGRGCQVAEVWLMISGPAN